MRAQQVQRGEHPQFWTRERRLCAGKTWTAARAGRRWSLAGRSLPTPNGCGVTRRRGVGWEAVASTLTLGRKISRNRLEWCPVGPWNHPTNKPLAGWGRVLNDKGMAHAIVNRLGRAARKVIHSRSETDPPEGLIGGLAGLSSSEVRWRGCSEWTRYMSFAIRCWWTAARSGRSPKSLASRGSRSASTSRMHTMAMPLLGMC